MLYIIRGNGGGQYKKTWFWVLGSSALLY